MYDVAHLVGVSKNDRQVFCLFFRKKIETAADQSRTQNFHYYNDMPWSPLRESFIKKTYRIILFTSQFLFTSLVELKIRCIIETRALLRGFEYWDH